MLFKYKLPAIKLMINELTITKIPEILSTKHFLKKDEKPSFDLYLPNVLNKTNILTECDDIQSQQIPRKRINRPYWWM
ncbi:hypothetical protein SAMD00079811_58130 [Scytonema sp. HK-05]|uniref:hypothetical protein n=1 Tax=Scytonema sp. HK-05 TaxID=1137095 RepID=UPI000937B2C6|nr:hypothetical protein [Scytonema sp. HK-05]OKH58823.1 hypothetical protein NIES2130_12005 [Scytonema sp. HK-05]BAY48192.1 hypothetical protein SAMD00079811_58130 [Scytonema sp. HK-05]